MADRLGEAGAQPQKQPRYAPIFVASTITGLYSQRHVFHDPSNVVTQKFYGGRPDTMFNGLNVELSNELTAIRRFGCSEFSTVTYPEPPTASFSFELDDGTIQVIIDTPGAVYVDNQNGTKTEIFTKSPGAGQGYFVASGNTLYYGDGIDTLKYTPGNPNGLFWLWGIVAPASQPSVDIVASGESAVAWVASTVFSTMGFTVDLNGYIQQLFGVNALGNNSTQIGETGNGAPAFNLGYGLTTTDGSVTWTSFGQITLWAANTLYQPGACIYDPATKALFIMSQTAARTSGTNRPKFTGILALGQGGPFVADANDLKWQNIGEVGVSPTAVQLWNTDTAFNQYQNPNGGQRPSHLNSAICFPMAPFISADGQLCNGQPIYLLGATTAGTTANTTYTPWTGITSEAQGNVTFDNQLSWINQGLAAWQADQAYESWVYGNATFSVFEDVNSNIQVCVGSGTSGSVKPGLTATLTAASNASSGNTTYTGTFPTPFTPGFPAQITGFTNAGNNATGTVISCNSTTLVISNPNGVAETHAGVAHFNPPGTTYGSQFVDGTVIWVNTGPSVAWSANTDWYLPAVGFAPPLASQAYGGADVVGSAFVQFVISSGLSGSSAPSWSTTVGNTTTDNGITWITVAPFTAQGITWTKSHVYAYSFKCRTPDDNYVTTSLLTFGGLNTPTALVPLGNVPGLTAALGPYQGGGTGAISTASPVFTIATPNTTGAVNVLSGLGSTDLQVDTIVIWRDADGGGPDNMLELVEIPAPKPIGGVAQPWTFKDFLPDEAQTIGGIAYPGLDFLSPAPIDESNNPPPAGFLPLCNKLHFSRIFGAVGNTVFFSGGPDVVTGNPNEAFNPDDDFPFESTVVACMHTPAGLICATTTDFECIYGGPATVSFYDTTMIPGVGMLSFNAFDQFGGEIFFLSADSVGYIITPSLQLAKIGFPVGDILGGYDASAAYVTVHNSGTDAAVYWGDGSVGWLRLNPHQVGADIAGENVSVWSVPAEIVGGCQMLQSIETAPGVRELLIGGTGNNQHILKRDLTVFSDNGSAYESWTEIGAITLCYPGQRAVVKFIECDFESVGTQPTVSYLFDDPTKVDPDWTALTQFVFDPPILYGGANITPNYWPDRFYINQNADVAVCKRVRIKVDFGDTDTVRNELISFAVVGKKYVEG
jgi:hypothetical protein